jgi:signal transduction histidine kinase/CheY-like chemotaxis protein
MAWRENTSETPANPAATDPLSERLAVEQIRLLYRGSYSVLAGVFGVAVLMTAALWTEVDRGQLSLWLSTFSVLLLARLVVTRKVLSVDIDTASVRRYGILFAVGTGLSGCMWGIGNWIFFTPDIPLVVAVLVTFTLGTAAGAATSTALYYPAYFAFLIPAVTPIALRLSMEGGILLPLGLAVGFYMVGSTFFARQFHAATNESLRLRFENIDLIEQGRLEKERAEQQQRVAEEANIAKSRFLAATSHDLRQPLHALSLFVDNLKTTQDRDTRIMLIDRVHDSVSALEALFNALLDISKLDAGVVEPVLEHFRLQDLFGRLGSELNAVAHHKKLSLRFAATSAIACSDPVLLERILRNVISNSLRYSDTGRVLVGARNSGGHLRIEVWDQGQGIPASELEKVFSEFHQLDNPERDRSKGLGLGLAIVKRLCSLLDYTCTLESRLGKGTVFRFTIPRGNPDKVATSTASATGDEVFGSGKSILVIDDEQDVLDSTALILEKWGHTVHKADDIDAAVSRAREATPPIDAIVTDYRLRRGNTGLDAIRAVEQVAERKLPAIIITGDSSPEILKLASTSGLALLHKPVKPSQLRMAIAKTVRSQGSSVEAG